MKTARFIERTQIEGQNVSIFEVNTNDKRTDEKIYFTLTDDQFNTYFDDENKQINTPLFSIIYLND